MSNFIVFGFVVLASLGLFLLFLIYYLSGARKGFYRKGQIMTEAELKFYKVLCSMLWREYDIFPQMRLASVVNIPESTAFFWKHFKPIGAKSVDFVLCDKTSGETILVIELDDKTHLEAKRQKRDKFVDSVCNAAGVPILHYKPQFFYNRDQLLKAINEKLPANSSPLSSK